MDKREAITASNLGPVVSVLTWIMMASVIIAVGIKVTLSSVVLGKRITEDVALFFATSFSVGFTITISLAVPNGVGRHQDTLSSNQLSSLQKAVYSSNILLVLVSSCAQSSVLIFLHGITPDSLQQSFIYGVAGFIALIFIPSLFVAIFPCHPPDVWRVLGGQCINQLSFWEAFAGMNLVIETALIILPILMVYPLMMERRRKVIVISGFAARLAVIAAFAFYLYETRRLKTRLVDWTFHSWRWLLASVFVQGLTIITVCIPYIRNLLLSMESGMIQTGHLRLPNRRSMDAEIPLPTISNGEISTNSSSNPNTKLKHPIASHGKDNGQKGRSFGAPFHLRDPS